MRMENTTSTLETSEDRIESGIDVAQMFFWSLLATIAMLFMALVSAYLVRRSGEDWWAMSLPSVLWWNAILLIPGTLAMEIARRNADAGQERMWIGISALLGMVFVAGQVYGWSVWAGQGVFLSTNPYSAFVYLLSGLHGLHVMGGVVWLLVILLMVRGVRRPVAVRCAADYWLFLAAVWIGLLGVLTFL